VRTLCYASPNLLAYFPRVRERGRDDNIARPVGGAIAGLLCKQDRLHGSWLSLDEHGMGLHRRYRPEHELNNNDRVLLARAGMNGLVGRPVGTTRLSGSVTMCRGSEAYAKYSNLPVRRFCLQIINTIAKATRWAVFEPVDSTLAMRLRNQVLPYLHSLHDLGAFANDKFIVQCDADISNRSDKQEHGITILLMFHPVACAEPISLTLHQTAAGFRVGSTAFGLTIRQSVG
ncbi:MAG: hypothetical protein HQ492_05390, partial [Woeseiaceae bacterium]|nr:hypothetical protein [Woeseiaceae bacterium]